VAGVSFYSPFRRGFEKPQDDTPPVQETPREPEYLLDFSTIEISPSAVYGFKTKADR
jgi:hypothetical protein